MKIYPFLCLSFVQVLFFSFFFLLFSFALSVPFFPTSSGGLLGVLGVEEGALWPQGPHGFAENSLTRTETRHVENPAVATIHLGRM